MSCCAISVHTGTSCCAISVHTGVSSVVEHYIQVFIVMLLLYVAVCIMGCITFCHASKKYFQITKSCASVEFHIYRQCLIFTSKSKDFYVLTGMHQACFQISSRYAFKYAECMHHACVQICSMYASCMHSNLQHVGSMHAFKNYNDELM